MRLVKLGEEVVELQPQLEIFLSNGLFGVGTLREGLAIKHVNGDFLKISMIDPDHSECRADPVNPLRANPESQIFEPRRLREVDCGRDPRSWERV